MRKTEQNHVTEPVRSAVEREEDLLEHIYRKWRKDEIVTIRDYAREQGVTGQEIVRLVGKLVEKEYLKPPAKRVVPLELTEKGKLLGMDCLARHEKLTQFFQMISGMEGEAAEEDACRMEHFISPKGLEGIEHFLQYGDVYDRRYEDMDLYTLYSDGHFTMPYGIYEPERRNPRYLAAEYDYFENKATLVIDSENKYYGLKPKADREIGNLWYNYKAKWIKSEKDSEGMYQIPTHIFTYTANTLLPITEATAMIATTHKAQQPMAMDMREINIHVW